MIEIVGLAIVAVLIAQWFGPAQWLKDKVGLFKYTVTSWLYCTKCTGLWLGVIVFQDLYKAAIVSLLAYLIGKLIDKLEDI
jgi:hypothetical protein